MYDAINLYHQAQAAQHRVEQVGCTDTARVMGVIVGMIGLAAGMNAPADGSIAAVRSMPRARRRVSTKVTAA